MANPDREIRIWVVISAFLALLLQIYFIPFIQISIWRPDLILLIVLFVGFKYGAITGTLTGFLFGIIQDSIGVGPLGLSSLSNCIVGFGAGSLLPFRLNFNSKMLASIILILIHGMIFFGLYQFKTDADFINLVLTRVFPNTIYTFAIGLAVNFILRSPLRSLS